ncbi:MAG: VWA domain-containing protein, partial [Flavonifractor plautii]
MKRIVSLLLAAVLAPLILCQSAAAEVSSSAPPQQNSGSIQKAVVFTLDASNSMNGNDRNRLAIDSIAQLIYSLPSNYVVGVVAYNTDVVAAQGMADSGSRDSIMRAADSVRYTGSTNAG